jgi:hypothetical protein
MPEYRYAVFIDGVRVLRMLVRPLGMLQRLPRALLPGLVILFLVGLRGATMSMRSGIVQLGRSLMILVM